MPRHPQIHVGEAWRADCTVCGTDAYANVIPAFASEREMWEALLSSHQYGWTRRDDGRILCRIHSAVADCDVHGHRKSSWTEHPLDDQLDWRYSIRCGGAFQQRIAASPKRQP